MVTLIKPMEAVLEARDLTLGYAGTKPPTILAQGLNLALHQGELVALLGPNGAGKTTLLRTLAGMQPPLAGSVFVAGKALHQLRPRELAQRLSIVLTDRPPLDMMTGFDLVALGRHPYTDWSGALRPHDRERVDWAINAVAATAFAVRPMSELSDGQRQKLMVARALAQETPLLLLDEPTAFLDLPRRVELMRLLRDCAREFQRAVLLSTHDLDLALRTADRVWLFSEHGELYDGAPEDLILSGAFAEIFLEAGIKGVEFDTASGTFQFTQASRGMVLVTLVDENLNLKAQWTRRALERAGYTPVFASSATRTALQIEVKRDGWQLHSLDQTVINYYDSLYKLIKGLEALRTLEER